MSLYRHTFPFLLGEHPAVDLLDYMVKCTFNFITKSHYFPYWLYHWMCDRNRCFAFSPPLGILFNFSHSSSVEFSHSVVSDSLRPHELQHARPPCPSPTPRVHPNPCPSSQWCHPTISSSVIPFSSCPQSFPSSGSFQMSQLFASGGQSVGVSASASVLPVNTQD